MRFEPDSDDAAAGANPSCFYRQLDDDVFESTIATMSPWDATLQHGGPPSALLARAVERAQLSRDLTVARFSVDFLGGLPQGQLTTSAQVLRPGRRIELIEATLSAGGRVVAVARAWAIKPSPDALPAVAMRAPSPPAQRPPAQPQRYPVPVANWGYGRAIEWRWVSGGFANAGRGVVWMRARIPLVEGEQPSGLQRMLLVADSTNGVSAALDMAEWQSVPPGLTVHAHRVDAGEWLLLDAETVIDASGIGLAQASIFDERGQLGLVTQPLLLQRLH